MGVSTLIYLWIELGHRGEVADATQTAGYTTNGEIVAGVFGLGFIGLGVVGFIVTAVSSHADLIVTPESRDECGLARWLARSGRAAQGPAEAAARSRGAREASGAARRS